MTSEKDRIRKAKASVFGGLNPKVGPVQVVSIDEGKRIEKVKSRVSYRLLKGWWDYLRTNPSHEDVLKKLYRLLDEKKVWGSFRNAEAAQESLDLLLEEERWI